MHPLLPEAVRKRREPRARTNLSLAQVDNNWDAFDHACTLKLMPTDTLDIHFARGGLVRPDLFGPLALRSILKSARQWIERRGYRTAYIWVLENRGASDGSGLHAHVVIHVPPELSVRFHHLRRRWARKAGLNMGVAGVIDRKPFPTFDTVTGKLQYMSKDLDPAAFSIFTAARGLPLDDRGKPSNQPVYVKKTGVSRNIDAGARAAYRECMRHGAPNTRTG